VFNRTYTLRSRRGGLVSAGAILEELVERAADRRRAKKRSGNLQGGLQLELFDEPITQQSYVPRDPDRPLLDLIPEAYSIRVV
jgi:hypothetical protein